ncbi:L,D-transpeptidase [Candidatus Fukatsuia symbiotica]|nr:L,D-transpeptidase [Candidatus Fukatsuia symbiotica]MEA9444475.1 L,D-transpeptidase [Candidatus Fukatsuia symbiotica]
MPRRVLAWSLIPVFSASAITSGLSVDVTSPPMEKVMEMTVSGAPVDVVLSETLPKNITPYYFSALEALYTANNWQPMWQDPTAIQRFQQQLTELAISGIQPQFIQWVKWLSDPSVNGMARDIVLSDAMLGYLHFVAGVAAHGNLWLYDDAPYKMGMPPVSLLDRWQQAIHQGDTAAYFSSLAPQHPQYEKMHQALKKLLADRQLWPQLPDGLALRPGQISAAIPALHNILSRSGMLRTISTSATKSSEAMLNGNDFLTDGTTAPSEQASIRTRSASDNRYNPTLVAAVKRFQQSKGLTPDGVIGARTREWLNVSPQMRANLLALNIQRLRLLPSNIESGIMVNIADYSLDYYQNGREILSSRVIVGRPSRKTPLMSSALSNVVVNPPWNVPTSMVRHDIVPKARYDASYFQRHGYTVLANWNNTTEVINPAKINWNVVSANNFPYRLRQAPGANNSLGRYKFNMPSSDAIYLHDTPNHNLFQKDMLALSSGCVRVNKASVLAKILLKDAGWDDARLSSVLQQGNTTYVNIRQHIPVLLYYLTAWIAKDGQPQFRKDIYSYDTMARSGTQISSQAEVLMQ